VRLAVSHRRSRPSKVDASVAAVGGEGDVPAETAVALVLSNRRVAAGSVGDTQSFRKASSRHGFVAAWPRAPGNRPGRDHHVAEGVGTRPWPAGSKGRWYRRSTWRRCRVCASQRPMSSPDRWRRQARRRARTRRGNRCASLSCVAGETGCALARRHPIPERGRPVPSVARNRPFGEMKRAQVLTGELRAARNLPASRTRPTSPAAGRAARGFRVKTSCGESAVCNAVRGCATGRARLPPGPGIPEDGLSRRPRRWPGTSRRARTPPA